MTDPNITRLPKQTLVQMVRNAPDTKLFNSLFVRYENSGEIQDICNDGEYSCAFFVGGLLTLTSYLPRPHGTVAGLRNKLQELGYVVVPSPDEIALGDIIFWDKIMFENGQANEHVGFALDKNTAVSTSYKKKCVVSHPLVLPGALSQEPRKITLILRIPDQPMQI
jgi:hypothetical protein